MEGEEDERIENGRTEEWKERRIAGQKDGSKRGWKHRRKEGQEDKRRRKWNDR